MSDIKFINIFHDIPEDLYPKPAYLCLPDWYKKTPTYYNNEKNVNGNAGTKTIKKCMPIFDSLTAGYIIFSIVDINVSIKDDKPFYSWTKNYNTVTSNSIMKALEFHDSSQLGYYPFLENEEGAPKITSPWGIKTPKGYSVFITTPMHRKLPFEILPAIVDTDSNHSAINFPFLLKDKKWSGVIPSGTPIAQVIPFKRESWKMSIGNKREQEQSLQQMFRINASFSNVYKKLNWNKKEFK
jgi:hypothetical protein